MRYTRFITEAGTLMLVLIALAVAAPPAAAQGHQTELAATACQDGLIAATVGSITTRTSIWSPHEQTFNFGMPEVTWTDRWNGKSYEPINRTASLGPFTWRDRWNGRNYEPVNRTVSLGPFTWGDRWNGKSYEPVNRTVTFSPLTWTDRGVAMRGVCVSYKTAVRRFMRER